MDRRVGRTIAYDAAYVASWVAGGVVESLQDNIRVEQALRSVIIASPEGHDTAQSAAAAEPSPPPSLTTENELEHQSD